jgi:hypothetical protein
MRFEIRRYFVRKGPFVPITALAILIALTCAGFTSSAVAQTSTPRFATLAPRYNLENLAAPATPTVTHWTGSLSAGGSSFTMVGADPATNNSPTTITAFVIPVRIVISPTPTGIFDPAHVLPNGRSVIQNTMLSPIFNSGIDFVQGGTDLGNTQYIDAYQRGNFWSDVLVNPNYHVLLNPVVLPEVTMTGTNGKTGTEFGVRVALVDINSFDAKLQQIISGNTQITPNSFVIALTYNTYLTSGGCCIGGYHSAFGSAASPQTYSHFTYIDQPGVFAQDVSALSHEVGEWMDDPFVNNPGCGGLLENGDPLEGLANFGAVPYTLNGFTYNLQDLVFLQYFGQSPSTSVNGWFSFQNAALAVCSRGQ